MKAVTSGRHGRWVSVACACGAAFALSAACGSDDGAKNAPHVSDSAGAGGDAGGHDSTNVAGDEASSAAGGGGSSNAGAAGSGEQTTPGDGGSESVGGAAGAGGIDGTAGAAGAGGASCDAVDPTALTGTWTTTCNGYTCTMNVAASGKVAMGCSNGQYESGTLDDEGPDGG